MLKKEIEVQIELSPMDLAVGLFEMDGDQQVEFFNLLAQLSRAWDRPLAFQLQAITSIDFDAFVNFGDKNEQSD